MRAQFGEAGHAPTSTAGEHLGWLTDDSPVGVARLDQDGVIERINDAFCAIFGAPREALLATSLLDHLDQADRGRGATALRDARARPRTVLQTDLRVRRGDSDSRHIGITLMSHMHGFGDSPDPPIRVVFMVQLVDVTNTERTLARLSDVNARLQAMFRYVPAAMSLRDLDARILTANAAMATLLRLASPEQCVGRRVEEIAPQLAVLADLEVQRVVVGTRAPVHRQLALNGTDGTPRSFEATDYPVLDDNRDVYAVGQVLTDVTEREQATWARDQALRDRSEALLLADLGAWTESLSDGGAEYSPQLFRLFGREPEAGPLPGYSLVDHVADSDRETLRQAHQELHEHRRPIDVTVTITTGHGNDRVLRLIARIDGDTVRGIAQDVTATRDVNLTFERRHERYRCAFEDSAIGMVVTDLHRKIIDVNPALCRLLGYSREELLQLDPVNLRPPDQQPAHALLHNQLTAGQIDTIDLEDELVRADGRRIWTGRRTVALRDPDGRPFAALTQVLDVSGARRQLRELQLIADQDPLTGVLNHRAFETRLAGLQPPTETTRQTVVMMVDVDRFKSVNDHFGHAAGDFLLIALADVLRGNVRTSDTVARLGGDEFAVLMEDCELATAMRTAQTIVRQISAIRLPDAGLAQITASIGLATLAQAQSTAAKPLVAADVAMYRAKATGGNRVGVYDCTEVE